MQEQIVVEIDAMSRACEGGLRTQNEKGISLKVVVHMYHTEDQERGWRAGRVFVRGRGRRDVTINRAFFGCWKASRRSCCKQRFFGG